MNIKLVEFNELHKKLIFFIRKRDSIENRYVCAVDAIFGDRPSKKNIKIKKH